MKKLGRRLTALGLAFVLALGAGQTAFASWALGTELVERTVPLAEGADFTRQSLWSASKSDLRTEHYITYTPGGAVKPVVYSGTYVASTNSVIAAASQLKAQGYRVAAAINGGFFNSDGTIVGMLATDGVVRSLDVENYTLLGFTNDGKVFIDESAVTKRVSWKQADGSDFSTNLAGYNAYRNTRYLSGAFLYNRDFSSKVSSGGQNVNAILRPVDSGVMKMNGTLTLEVVSVADTAQEGVSFNGSLPEGCYMLYAQYQDDNAWLTDGIRDLVPGQQVAVSVGGVSSQWNDAAYGISGLYTLLRGGEIVPDLPATANPYTAVGVKADGTAVFYTIDGRQSGYSVGATYAQVAQRLQELGCVSAVALDGGGSTNLGATLPGSGSFGIQNRPSTNGRRVNNAILLVMPDSGPSGVPDGAYVTAPQQVVLAGSELAMGATPYDTAGYPMDSQALVWSADGGSIRGNGSGAVFSSLSPGTFTVSADPSGNGSMPVRVVDALDSLRVAREGSSGRVSSLTVDPGEMVDLGASGFWRNLPVAMGDGDVTWWADAAIGSIDASGRFTASSDRAGGNGSVTAAAGGKTATVKVTVQRLYPFADIAGHWSADYVDQLYARGLTTGYSQPNGTAVFRPDGKLTRGELLAFITRLLNVDTGQYADVRLPFADVGSIDGWLLPYVKSMYALGVLNGSVSGGGLYANVNSNVSREEAMTMLGRMLADRKEHSLSGFADGGSVSGWALPYVQTLVALDIVEGSDGRLNPKADITRGEMAKLLMEVDSLEKAPLAQRPAPSGDGAAPGTQNGVDPNGAFVNPTERPTLPDGDESKPANPDDPFFDPLEWTWDDPLFNNP